jgi:hypothetical protein
MVSRVTTPGILILGTGRRWVVNFTLLSLYLPKMRALYPLHRVLADSQARFGRFGPMGNQTTILLSCGLWSNHYPDWRILASSKYHHYGLLAVRNSKLQFCGASHIPHTNARIVSVCTSHFLPSYFLLIFLIKISFDILWSHYRSEILNLS